MNELTGVRTVGFTAVPSRDSRMKASAEIESLFDAREAATLLEIPMDRFTAATLWPSFPQGRLVLCDGDYREYWTEHQVSVAGIKIKSHQAAQERLQRRQCNPVR